jgi:hypothetical protein
MRELVVDINERFQIPREYRNKKVLTVKQRWVTEVHRGRSVMMYFRYAPDDKPYLPEGIIEINKEQFKVIHPNFAELIESLHNRGKSV